MNQVQRMNAVIIGSGQAGTPLSTALANAGWTVALIEREHMGGTCINEGCTPTKTMVASARAAYAARRSDVYGVHTGPVDVKMVEVRQRKRDIVESFRSSNRQRVLNAGIELVEGEAHFVAPRRVEVALNDGGTRILEGDKVFIDTGAHPFIPPIEGLDGVPYLNSTTIMELSMIPRHLLVMGGGYVGLEFGQMFRRFGSQVTILQRGEQVLSREDADVAEAVTEILREDDIDVVLNTEAVRVEQTERGDIRIIGEGPEGERTFTGSHLLVATGRVPNTGSLNLDAAGVETTERGHVVVNARLETTAPGVYAVGDVKGGPAFTHISYDDFRVLRANLLEDGGATIEGRMVPYTVFIDPQLGRVGLGEKAAKEKGLDYRVATLPMSQVARAIETEETRGFMKALVDAETDRILGVAILGKQGGELMSMVEIAMMGDLPYTALRDAIFTHPLLAEALNNLFATLSD